MKKYLKKYLTLGNILVCSAAVLALISIFLMFAPAICIKDTDTAFTGAQVAFGHSETVKVISEKTYEVFKFSFMNFFTYLLALIGIVFAVLAILGKLGKISGFVAAGCFLISGIFYFLAVPYSIVADDFTKVYTFITLGKDVKEVLTLGAGAIVSGIFSLISAILCVVPMLVKKK